MELGFQYKLHETWRLIDAHSQSPSQVSSAEKDAFDRAKKLAKQEARQSSKVSIIVTCTSTNSSLSYEEIQNLKTEKRQRGRLRSASETKPKSSSLTVEAISPRRNRALSDSPRPHRTLIQAKVPTFRKMLQVDSISTSAVPTEAVPFRGSTENIASKEETDQLNGIKRLSQGDLPDLQFMCLWQAPMELAKSQAKRRNALIKQLWAECKEVHKVTQRMTGNVDTLCGKDIQIMQQAHSRDFNRKIQVRRWVCPFVLSFWTRYKNRPWRKSMARLSKSVRHWKSMNKACSENTSISPFALWSNRM